MWALKLHSSSIAELCSCVSCVDPQTAHFINCRVVQARLPPDRTFHHFQSCAVAPATRPHISSIPELCSRACHQTAHFINSRAVQFRLPPDRTFHQFHSWAVAPANRPNISSVPELCSFVCHQTAHFINSRAVQFRLPPDRMHISSISKAFPLSSLKTTRVQQHQLQLAKLNCLRIFYCLRYCHPKLL